MKPELNAMAAVEMTDDSTDNRLRMLAVLALASAALGYVPSVTALHQHGGDIIVAWRDGKVPMDPCDPSMVDQAVQLAFARAWAVVDGLDPDDDVGCEAHCAVEHVGATA